MKNYIPAILALCLSLSAVAQKQTVSGTVKDAQGNPIAGVSVRELDHNRRVVKQTKSDANGLFSFPSKDTRHYIQFVADGYRRLTHKMMGYTLINATLDPRTVMPLNKKGKVVMRTDKLICGHQGEGEVPLTVWMEQFSDTLYAFIIPVEVESEVDEYPAGRTLTILDQGGKQMMQLENVVDAYPTSPRSDEGIVMTQSYAGVDNVPGQSTVKRRYFVQPHFAVTASQLRTLMNRHQSIARILVDTYRADNYWNYYLSSQAGEVDLSMVQ